MIHRFRNTVRTDREGATLAVVAVMIVALLGLMAFGIDLGMAYTARAEAQRAADSAALAGASVFLRQPQPFMVQDTADAWAREYAARNMVRARLIDPDEDVTVQVDLAEQRVRVRVERRSLPVWFARFLGQETLTVSAVAAARVMDSGAAECLKPWAVIDLFHVNGQRPPPEILFDPDNPAHRYEPNTSDAQDPTGWGAQASDLGQQFVIKSQDPNSDHVPQPGVFLPLRLPEDDNMVQCLQGGGGGAEYANNICGCNNNPTSIGDSIPIQTGNVVGPTRRGVNKLLAEETRPLEWSDEENAVVIRGTSEVVTSSPLIVPMILIGPDQIVKSGMQDVVVRNMSLFFVEGFEDDGNKAEVTGRFFGPVKGLDSPGPITSPDIQMLRLVE